MQPQIGGMDQPEFETDPPEQRLIKTKMSFRPKVYGFHIGAFLIFLSALISLMSWRSSAFYDRAAVGGEDFQNGVPWLRLLSSLFVHADIAHLLSNSYMILILSIFVFGTLTPNVLSAIGLLAFALLAAVGVSVWTLSSYPVESHLIGISGLVYFLGAFWFMNFMGIERRLSVGARLLRALGVGIMIFFPTSFEPTTSYLAHYHGFVLGMVMGWIYFLLKRDWYRSFERYQWV